MRPSSAPSRVLRRMASPCARAVAEATGNVAICRLGVAEQLRDAQTGKEHLWAAVARPRELADEGRP
eukprot:7465971-Pyramimonas_sp.AAC.1